MSAALKEQLEARIEKIVDNNDLSGTLGAAESKCGVDGKSLKNRKVLKGHFAKVYSIAWCMSEEEKHRYNLVSASQDGKLIIWNALTTNKVAAIPLRSSWVMTCSYSPNTKLVACGGLDNICSIYNISDPKKIETSAQRELVGHTGYLSACKFIEGSDDMLTSSGDMSCLLWDTGKGESKHAFWGHNGDVMSVSMRPDGKNSVFVSGACDSEAKIWDMNKKDAVRTFNGHESDINAVAFFPDGNAFVTGSDDASVRLWGLRSGTCMQQYTHEKILCGITSIDTSLAGRFLFAGYDDFNCYVWDTLTGKQIGVLAGHDNRVSTVGTCYDGMALCTGSWDSFLKIWA